VLLVNFGGNEEKASLRLLHKLHGAGIPAELFPEAVKMKKRFAYADNKKIPFTVIVGSEEAASEIYKLKNMQTGEQQDFTEEKLIEFLL
jgi:histidyl-tRNA synthetase